MGAITLHVDGWDVEVIDGVERVGAFEVARRGGLAKPRNVAALIERNREELLAHGELPMRLTVGRIEKTGAIAGVELREVEEPMVNEGQALALLARMRTPNGVALRVALVKLFLAVRHNRLAVQPIDYAAIGVALAPTIRSAIEAGVAAALQAVREERRVEGDGMIGGARAKKLLGEIRTLCTLQAQPGSRAWRSKHRTLCTEIRDVLGLRSSGAWERLPIQRMADIRAQLDVIGKRERAQHRVQQELFAKSGMKPDSDGEA